MTYIGYYSYDNFVTKEILKENEGFWLKFDSTSRRFFGTPNLTNISTTSLGKYQDISIEVIATDIAENNATGYFNLTLINNKPFL